MAKVVKGVVKAIGAIASVLAVIPSPIQPIAAVVATVASIASVGLEMIFPTKPKPPDLAGSQTSFRLDPNAGIPYMIGRTYYAGSVVHRDTWGKDNQYHGMALVWSGGGPIEEIESFQVDLVDQAFSGTAATGKYAGFMNLSTQLGATPSPLLASPIAGFPGWSGGMSGYCGGVWVCTFDKEGDKFAGGLPKAGIIGKGVRVYDPRLDSTYPGGAGSCRIDDQSTWVGGASARNPWLHGLAIALGRWENGKKVFGIGMAAASLNLASIVDAANVADANGWEVGGMLSSTDDKWGMLKLCAQAGGGQFVKLGAQLTAFVNAPRVSLATIEESDIVGASKIKGTQHIRSRINRVVPQFRSEAHGWEIIPGSAVAFQDYIDEDGGRRTAETTFGLVQDADQAGNLAAYEIVNAREIGPIDLELSIAWAGLEPGDAVTVNLPSLGLVNRKCVVLARGLDPTTGNVAVSLRTETDAKHALALGTSTIVPPTPSLSPRDLSIVEAPEAAAWTLAAVQGTGPNGEAIPVLEITGAADNQTAEAIIVRYREVTDPASGWVTSGDLDPATTRVALNSLIPATAYEAEIAYRVFGVTGAFRNLGSVVTGALTAGGFVNGGALAYEDAVAFNDGTVLESAGGAIATLSAFRTADGTAAAIAGQGGLATRSTVGLPQMIDGADYSDLVVDRGFNDFSNSWVTAAGTLGNYSLVEGATATALEQTALDAMGVDRALKFEGDGDPHGGAGTGFTVARPLVQATVTPGEAFRFRAKIYTEVETGGFPARIVLTWFRADGGLTYTVPTATGLGLHELESRVVVPANVESVQISWQPIIPSGSTENRDVIAYMSGLSLRRIAQFGADVVRDDGTTPVADADAITAVGTAAAFAGQGAFATRSVLDFATMSAFYSNFDTSHILDGAGLGESALWSGVSGTGRPEDYATSSGSGANLVRTPDATNGDGGWVVIGTSEEDAPPGAAAGAKSFAILDGSREVPAYEFIPAGRYRLRYWLKTLGHTGGTTRFLFRTQSGGLIGGISGNPATAQGLDWHFVDVECVIPSDLYDACPAWDLSANGGDPPRFFGLRLEEIIPTPWDLVTDDGNRPEDGADVTATNTAAAIAGQGIGATSNSLADLDGSADDALSAFSTSRVSLAGLDSDLFDRFFKQNDATVDGASVETSVSSYAASYVQINSDNKTYRHANPVPIGPNDIVEFEAVLSGLNASATYRLGYYGFDDADAVTANNAQIGIVTVGDTAIKTDKIRIGGANVDAGRVDLKVSAATTQIAPHLRANVTSAWGFKLYALRVSRLSAYDAADIEPTTGRQWAAEAGADVTANAQRTIASQFPVVEIKEGQAGNSGTRTVTHSLLRGTTAQTGVTWSIQSNDTGGTCTVNASTGTVSLSGITASGAYTIRATKDGIPTDRAVNVTFVPSGTGASAKTGTNSNSSGWGTSSSFATVLELNFTSAPVGRLFFNAADLGSEGSKIEATAGTGTAEYQFRIRLVDGASTTYPVTGTAEEAVSGGVLSFTNFEALFGTILNIVNGGTVKVALEARRVSGTGQITTADNVLDANIIAS